MGGSRVLPRSAPDEPAAAVGAQQPVEQVAGDRLEAELQVAHLADDRALTDGDAAPAGIRRPPGRRLEAGDAAERGRDLHAAAEVGAEPQRRPARGDDRSLAAAADAGRAAQVPGVVRPAVERIVRFQVEQGPRDVRRPEYDRPGGPQPRHVFVVLGRERVGPRRQAEGRGRAGEVQRLLHGDRHAVQRASALTPGDRGVGLAGFGAGPRRRRVDDGIEGGVDRLDAPKVGVHHLRRRHLPRPDGPG